jgi:pyrroloquinoline-quinone synthase
MSKLKPASEICDDHIAARSLLEHAFYVAWNNGTLPVAALKDYARDYGSFIRTVGAGWASIGEPHIAAIEAGHAEVWNSTFAAGLETMIADEPLNDEARGLAAAALGLFDESRPAALGALYAFEAQQPATSRTKLSGLQKHYSDLPECCGEYFRLHSDDHDEPAYLAAQINALPAEDQESAVASCARMAAALHDALTGLHAPYLAGVAPKV